MSADIDARFESFKASYLAGDGNPAPMLDGLEPEDRRRLTRLIEAWLDTDPKVEVTVEMMRSPANVVMAQRVAAELDGATGGLSALLTGMRRKLELKQSQVVDDLAAALDADDQEKAKIESYYHDIEYGNLPSRGITDQAFELIAKVFRTDSETLKAAAARLGPAQASTAGPVFARMVDESELIADQALSGNAPSGEARRSNPPDRIDELFTGAE